MPFCATINSQVPPWTNFQGLPWKSTVDVPWQGAAGTGGTVVLALQAGVARARPVAVLAEKASLLVRVIAQPSLAQLLLGQLGLRSLTAKTDRRRARSRAA